MPTPSNGTAPDDASPPSSQTETVLLEVLAEVLMETYRTSAQVKLLLRSLSDEMTEQVDEDRDTVRQALEAISEGDVKAKVQQLARRLEAKGIPLGDDALAPLADKLNAHLDGGENPQQP